MDKISIILPTRNRWDMLRYRAIPSILNQTHQNWELIIVHDGKIDNLKFKEWAEFNTVLLQQPRIQFYSIEKTYPYPEDNKKAEWLAGPCLALNEALKHVTGDWIYRCDDDDILLPDCLESLLGFATKGHPYLGEYDLVSALWKDKNDLIGMPDWIEYHQVGGVQTWLYKAEYRDVLYNPECWKKKWNSNNEWDWFERFIKTVKNRENRHPKIGVLSKVVVSILPRPGESEIGSKALCL